MVQRERFAVKKKPKDTRGTLIRIAKYLSDYLWIVILLVVLSFLSNLGNLMGPRFAGKAIGIAEEGFRRGVGQVDMETVVHYALLMALASPGRADQPSQDLDDPGGPPGGPEHAAGRVPQAPAHARELL